MRNELINLIEMENQLIKRDLLELKRINLIIKNLIIFPWRVLLGKYFKI